MNEAARVLIVEDASNWRRTLETVLRHKGCRGVVSASSYEEGLAALEEGPYLLAIVDVRLVEAEPNDASGLALVKLAWQRKAVRRVILISAHRVEAQVRAELGDAIPYRFFSKADVVSREFQNALEDGLMLGNARGEQPAPLAAPAQQNAQPRHALVVEDEEGWNRLHQVALKRLGLDAAIVKCYADAVDLLKSREFELAVVDLRLACDPKPENLHGVFLLEWLAVKQIPVLIVSGWELPGLVDAIVDEYPYIRLMDKSGFNPAAFEASVKQAVEMPPPPRAEDPGRDQARRKKFEGIIKQVLAGCPDQPDEKRLADAVLRKHRRAIRGHRQGSASRTAITWLHLSDLHFRATDAAQGYNRDVVLTSLLADLRTQVENGQLRPDFIAITGDLAYSGQRGEYALVGRFLDELLAVTGVQRDRLFLVPGNHDVERGQITRGVDAIRKDLTCRDKVTEVLTTAQDRALIMTPCEGYTRFVGGYYAGAPLYDKDCLFYAHVLELPGQRVAILGLNSAWAGGSDQDRAAGLIVGEWQARGALARAEEADLNIALLHHPLDWLREFDQDDSGRLLQDRCDFILHGHLHQPRVRSLTDPDGSTAIIAAGACYETRDYPNIYNYVQLDPATRAGTVTLRQFAGKGGEFWAPATLIYQHATDGKCRFKLSKNRASS